MGSSQMEAFQVGMKESTSALLNNMLEDQRVYNIGVSSHTFLYCTSNLKDAIKKYKPKKNIIIETSTINFEEDLIEKTIKDELEDLHPPKVTGFLRILHENPFLRLVYKQVKKLFGMNIDGDEEIENVNNSDFNNKELVNELLVKIKNIVSTSDAKLIIMYHPSTTLDNNGNLELSSEQENVEEFSELCKENGIYFLDMSERFKEEYENNFILPYGFSNTSVGYGHLNKYGHEMIADELYKFIEEVE